MISVRMKNPAILIREGKKDSSAVTAKLINSNLILLRLNSDIGLANENPLIRLVWWQLNALQLIFRHNTPFRK